MMTVRTIGILSAWAGMSMLGACASTGTAEPGRATCRPTGAAALVGKIAPDDAIICTVRAVRSSGASLQVMQRRKISGRNASQSPSPKAE